MALESSAIRAVAIVDLVIAAGSVCDEANRRRAFSVGEGSSGRFADHSVRSRMVEAYKLKGL